MRGSTRILIAGIGAALTLNAGAAQKRYVVGIEHLQYFPLHTIEGGHFGGAARVILDAFAKKMGYEFVYLPLPLVRLQAEFASGKTIDFKYPDDASWHAGKPEKLRITYSAPMIDYTDGMMVLRERKGLGIGQIRNVAVPHGFTTNALTTGIGNRQLRLSRPATTEAALKMTRYGRVDAAYLNVTVARHQQLGMHEKPEALVFDPALPHQKSSYRLSSIRHPDVIAEFNDFLHKEKVMVDQVKLTFGVN